MSPDRRTFAAALALVAACVALPAAADTGVYPSKPVRILVPFPAGGAADVLARMVGEKLSQAWHVGVVVENRAGAGGTIGMTAAKQMPADGYAFSLMSNSVVISQALYPKVAYDMRKDFAPVYLIGDSPIVIAANPKTGIATVADLLRKAKEAPGKLTYGSCGVGTAHHLAMEVLKSRSGANIVHVPYRGCAPAVTDVVGGQTDVVISSAPSILPYTADGRLHAIAVTNARRAISAPAIPTVAESGVPALKSLVIGNWYGFVAPRGTPAEALAKFEADTRAILQAPEMVKKLAAAGVEVRLGSAQDLARAIDTDLREFGQVIEAAHIKPE